MPNDYQIIILCKWKCLQMPSNFQLIWSCISWKSTNGFNSCYTMIKSFCQCTTLLQLKSGTRKVRDRRFKGWLKGQKYKEVSLITVRKHSSTCLYDIILCFLEKVFCFLMLICGFKEISCLMICSRIPI